MILHKFFVIQWSLGPSSPALQLLLDFKELMATNSLDNPQGPHGLYESLNYAKTCK